MHPGCRGANLIRLDAFGYTTKKRSTNCFFVEPEIWDLLERVRDKLRCAETKPELLCEVHEHYLLQKMLAEKGLWVYDFALPMLCLQVWCCSGSGGRSLLGRAAGVAQLSMCNLAPPLLCLQARCTVVARLGVAFAASVQHAAPVTSSANSLRHADLLR